MNLPIFWYVGFGWVGLEKNPAVDPPRTAPYLINPKKRIHFNSHIFLL